MSEKQGERAAPRLLDGVVLDGHKLDDLDRVRAPRWRRSRTRRPARVEPEQLQRRCDGDEQLLGGPLRDAERAPDVRPAAAGRPRRLHEVVDEFVRAFPHALGELRCGGESFERPRVARLRLDPAEKVRLSRSPPPKCDPLLQRPRNRRHLR